MTRTDRFLLTAALAIAPVFLWAQGQAQPQPQPQTQTQGQAQGGTQVQGGAAITAPGVNNGTRSHSRPAMRYTPCQVVDRPVRPQQ